jgi:hypothetical protein
MKTPQWLDRLIARRRHDCPQLKVHTDLFARVMRRDEKTGLYVPKDLGLLGHCRKFTTAGRDFIIDSLQNLTEDDLFKFHGSGTGVAAESNADTVLGTEVETRDTGTQTENGSGTYRTVATHTYGGTFAITEHGIFSASSGGTLLDRTVFTAINVVNTDQIEFTFDLTIAAEA